MPGLFELPTCSGATFSECRRYRYSLYRDWGDSSRFPGRVAFIGLNPSTADETADDPTIRRCIDFAKRWDFCGMWMLNAYAFRSTNPKGLLLVDDPIGPENDRTIECVCREVELVVACWGNHCTDERQKQVIGIIQNTISNLSRIHLLQCLGRNTNGTPKHPLYLAKSTQRVMFD